MTSLSAAGPHPTGSSSGQWAMDLPAFTKFFTVRCEESLASFDTCSRSGEFHHIQMRILLISRDMFPCTEATTAILRDPGIMWYRPLLLGTHLRVRSIARKDRACQSPNTNMSNIPHTLPILARCHISGLPRTNRKKQSGARQAANSRVQG